MVRRRGSGVIPQHRRMRRCVHFISGSRWKCARSSLPADVGSGSPAAGEWLAHAQPEPLEQLRNRLRARLESVARNKVGELLRTGLERAAERRKLTKVSLETRGRDDLKDPAGRVTRVPEGVPLVAWLEHQVASTGLDNVVAQQRSHPSLKHEAVLVLARVTVQRRSERPWRHRMLEKREPIARFGAVDQKAHANAAEKDVVAVRRPDNSYGASPF